MKTALFLLFAFFISVIAQAQEKKAEEPDVFIYRLPEMPTFQPGLGLDQMPKKDISSFGTDQQTGQPAYYSDPESGLFFNFQQRKITDFSTGETYSFDVIGELLKKEKPQAQPQQEAVITL